MPNTRDLRNWVINRRFQYYTPIILQRPSAEAYPNTFVMMWKNVVIAGYTVAHVCLDLHYSGDEVKGGEALQALGGMWAKGIHGSLKPQQNFAMRTRLSPIVPATSPDPSGLEKFGAY